MGRFPKIEKNGRCTVVKTRPEGAAPRAVFMFSGVCWTRMEGPMPLKGHLREALKKREDRDGG